MKKFQLVPLSGKGRLFSYPSYNHQAKGVWMLLFSLSLILFSCSKKDEIELKTSLDNVPGTYFKINASENQVIRGEQGAIFAIPHHAFTDSAGNPIEGEITIHIREGNTFPAILAGGLITRTGDKMLSTGGMYMFEAKKDFQRLKLNPDRGIFAFFPSTKKQKEMGLYLGEFQSDKLDWKLVSTSESSIPVCNGTKEEKKKCKSCEQMVNKLAKVKTGKKPKKGDWDDYYVDRYYWENGVLYFYSSGSVTPITSDKQIQECKQWMELSQNGQELLALVEKVKQDQKENFDEYYSYRINNLGWYNIDRCVQEDLISFKGKVVDEKGNPVSGAQVHLICKDDDMRVHISTTAEDGSFKLEFVPGKDVKLFAFLKDKAGRLDYMLRDNTEDIGEVSIAVVDEQAIDAFVKELM